MPGPELFNGDKILKLSSDGFKLGQITKYGEIEQQNLRASQKYRPSLRVLWDGHRDKDYINDQESYEVYDRNFFIGQEVQFGDLKGRVLDCHELFLVQRYNKNKDILGCAVHVDDLTPVKKLFVGVHVELNGWVGVISEVIRNLRISFKKKTLRQSSQCFIKKVEPKLLKNGKMDRRYPLASNFLRNKDTNNYVPFRGKRIDFNIRELEKYGNWIGQNPLPALSKIERRKRIRGRVLYSKDDSALVNWIKIIPSMTPAQEKPPYIMVKKDFRRLRYFYINPNRYVNSGGICSIQISSDDVTMSQENFSQHYWNLLQGNIENKTKKAKLDVEDKGKGSYKEIEVLKYFSFHMYHVQMSETEKVEIIPGRDLIPLETPIENIVPKTQFPGIYYVIKVGESLETGEYGVVLNMEMVDQDIMCKIQWLRIMGNEIVKLEAWNETRKSLLIHPKYNDLRPGAIVHNSQIPNKVEFQFGNICSVDRYNYGKLHVYCAIGKVKKQLWPHQLEVLKLNS